MPLKYLYLHQSLNDEEIENSILASKKSIGPKVIDTFVCKNNKNDQIKFMLMEKLDGILQNSNDKTIDNTILKLTKTKLYNLFDKLFWKIIIMSKYIYIPS